MTNLQISRVKTSSRKSLQTVTQSPVKRAAVAVQALHTNTTATVTNNHDTEIIFVFKSSNWSVKSTGMIQIV
jgi:hypothetical protein